ncbi:unnamed protein product [Alopecurus aequalis]
MVDLDLNVPADGFKDDIEPQFYMQATVLETVGESPDPTDIGHGNLDGEDSARGLHRNLILLQPSNPSVPTTTAPTTSTQHGIPEDVGDGGGVNEEVASTP